MGDARQLADFVFEGGGVKDIGLVGAYSVLSTRYRPANVAGTSAEAIVGALVAAGYTAAALQTRRGWPRSARAGASSTTAAPPTACRSSGRW